MESADGAAGSPRAGARGRGAVALCGIVAVGLALRLAGLGDRLSDAEGYSWLVASAPSVEAFLDRLADYENTPPLFYALLAPLPDGDEAWLRVPALAPGLAAIPVLYFLVRPLAGTAAALLAALGLAVAPFQVSYSNYSRGFMLATLGVLLAAWAVGRLAQGRAGRWWWLWLAGATLALWSEYDAALFLAPLLALPALARRWGWRRLAAMGALPLLTLAPFAGEIAASIRQIDVTKLTPPAPEPSLDVLARAAVASLTGTNGVAEAAGLRAAQAVLLATAITLAAVLVWRGGGVRAPAPGGGGRASAAGSGRAASRRDGMRTWVAGDRRTVVLWLFAVVPAAAFALHVAVTAVGPNVIEARYLTPAVPLVVGLLACGVVALPWRWAPPAAAGVLLALGVAVFSQRHDRELQPDFEPAAEAVRAAGAETVLTNSAVAAYHLRDRDTRLDRAFGLGDDEPRCARECRRPLAVIEDVRLPGGERGGAGERTAFGPVTVRIVP